MKALEKMGYCPVCMDECFSQSAERYTIWPVENTVKKKNGLALLIALNS